MIIHTDVDLKVGEINSTGLISDENGYWQSATFLVLRTSNEDEFDKYLKDNNIIDFGLRETRGKNYYKISID